MNTQPPPLNRLTRQIQFFAKVHIALAAALVMALAAFYFGFYRPQDQKITELSQKITEKQQELADDQSQTSHLPRVENQLRILKARLAGFKKLPMVPDLGNFIHDITQASQKAALKNLTVEPGTSLRDELFSQEPIVLTFKGDFPAVASFIRQVEDMDRLTRVHDVSIKTTDSAEGLVDASLTVDIYFAEAQ